MRVVQIHIFHIFHIFVLPAT